MAGVKGRSGGARPNTGGPRPDPGRPRKPPVEAPVPPAAGAEDMLQLLKDIAMGRVDASPTQVKAAIAAVAYTHQKPGDAGKKEQRQTEAESIASGKFGARQPPKLVASR